MNRKEKCEKYKMLSYNLIGDCLKKIFEGIGLISLVCFSFYYTSKITSVVKANDNIIKQINDILDQYENEPIDAIINGDMIIPGISGSKINVEESYKKMKKINTFNYNLLVYDKIKPKVSVNNVYDKYITSGNKLKHEVSFLFLIKDNDDILPILNILNNYNLTANFFASSNWINNNYKLVVEMILKGNIIGLSTDNLDNISWVNTIIKNVGVQYNNFCYNLGSNSGLNICNKNLSYTIKPSILVENPYIDIKHKMTNGSLISFNINNKVITELPIVINYVESKGLKIVNLQKIIEE